jgi:hypothetical protein
VICCYCDLETDRLSLHLSKDCKDAPAFVRNCAETEVKVLGADHDYTPAPPTSKGGPGSQGPAPSSPARGKEKAQGGRKKNDAPPF